MQIFRNEVQERYEHCTHEERKKDALTQEMGRSFGLSGTHKLGGHAWQGKKAAYGKERYGSPKGSGYGDTGKVARSVAAGHDGVHKVHANLRELGNKDGKTYAQDISEFPGRNKKSHM